MKKIIVIVLFMLSIVMAEVMKNGTDYINYLNGNLKSSIDYEGGKRNGWSRYYNKDGTLIEEKYYKDDKVFNGFEKDYYDNGNLRYEAFFIDGKREGSAKSYYYSGKLNHLTMYKYEKLLYSKSYFENGTVSYETIYDNGKEIESKEYYKTGVLKKISNKEQDLEYYPNGQIAVDWSKDESYPPTAEEFLKTVRGGTYMFLREPVYTWEREKLIGTPYKNIEKDYDLRKYTSDNGDVREIIHYRNGKKEDLAVKLYYAKGYYIKTTMYKNNKKNGYETIYKKKGNIGERKIQTLLSRSSGIYDKTDILVSKVLYVKGKKVDGK